MDKQIANTERIRFGRTKSKTPKNTLITKRYDGVIFFGVARCHSKLDYFSKRLGKHVATERLYLAVEEPKAHYQQHGALNLHPNGLRGFCVVQEVKQLLQYFDNIDKMWYKDTQYNCDCSKCPSTCSSYQLG